MAIISHRHYCISNGRESVFLKNNKIGCVVVTFNRLEKLKKALAAYEKQEMQPVYLIVVDNASTDGTDEFLRQWKMEDSKVKRYVLSLKKISVVVVAFMKVKKWQWKCQQIG